MPRKLTFAQFAALLEAAPEKIRTNTDETLRAAAPLAAEKAKAKIGHYQQEIGHFPDWAPLAEATIDDKRAHGYPAPKPLLRTGEMRASIEAKATATTLRLGSNDPVAVDQELGTKHIPPRPFLAPTLYQIYPLIRERLSGGLLRAFGIRGVFYPRDLLK